MAKKTLKLIKETSEELLKRLKIKAKVKVEEDEGEVVHVSLETEETGILIGYHGETLSALQLILGLIIYKKQGSWTRIVLNVGDYRERREETLKQMALRAAERVRQTGEAVSLPFLNAGERRIIHLILEDSLEVSTESEGEGENRKLIIKPKIQGEPASTKVTAGKQGEPAPAEVTAGKQEKEEKKEKREKKEESK